MHCNQNGAMHNAACVGNAHINSSLIWGPRLLCRLPRAFAQLLGLLSEDLHLALYEVGLQLYHLLNILCPNQLLRQFFRTRGLLAKAGLPPFNVGLGPL
jgi:hypothetical protein